LGLDRTGYSPRVQKKMVRAGVKAESYAAASQELAEQCDLNIGPKAIERLGQRIGQERIDQRDAAVAAHETLPLMKRDGVADPGCPCPAVAMVSVDGGRLQVRPSPSDAKQSSHWRESKTAVLETYLGETHEVDPDPDVPRCFLDLKRTTKMVRGLGHALPAGLEFEGEDASPRGKKPARRGRARVSRPGRPKRLVRSVLASRARSEDFGPMMHQAAWGRNFFGAKRQVFLGDGAAVNWTIHREHFSTFLPVLDFVHALSYVFAAAFAGQPLSEGTEVYRRWIQAVWSGHVATILAELERRSAELGEPPEDGSESDPRRLVFEALRYLRNNAGRMQYDTYRRQGLPIMTSAVESAIKMINRRVKGSEKFWSERGAEAILQLRADYLSETEIVKRFWSAREAMASGFRPYRRTA
jgi:hypothetical protein